VYHLRPEFAQSDRFLANYASAFAYSDFRIGQDLIWTVGASIDTLERKDLNQTKLNPKLGIMWDVSPNLRLRLAAFRTLKPPVLSTRTVQPTQVAGFNQFFDDLVATEAWRYGGGLDLRLTNDLSVGIEASERRLQAHRIPILSSDPDAKTVHYNNEEQLYRGYIYWTPHPEWALTWAFEYDNYDAEHIPYTGQFGNITKVSTWSSPLSARYFSQFGFTGVLSGTLVFQEVNRQGNAQIGDVKIEGDSDFLVLDAAVGYRFPERFGIAILQGINLLNTGFKYQDNQFRSATVEPVVPPFVPERTILVRLTLNL
jgi:outer membrane receptor protein involved in Fe transport